MSLGGRPREFAEDAVLDAAVELFWTRGYASTSTTDVLQATGLGRQSLYNAFGDKRALFLRCLDRYKDRHLSAFVAPLEREDADLSGVRSALLRFARGQTRGDRRACLLLNSAMELGSADDEVRARTQSYMRRLRRVFQLAVKRTARGTTQPEAKAAQGSARAAAESLVALTLGLHVMARAGASERAMGDAVDGAMRALHY